jgi:hypothetical protein
MSKTNPGKLGRAWKKWEEDFAAAEPEVAKFAHAGLQGWRNEGVDVAALLRLEAVREKLIGVGADAEREAVERAIEAAIERLPKPFAPAAKAHFGFDPDLEGPGIVVRQERAANLLATLSGRWYRQANSKYLGLQPEEYVVALVAASLAGADDSLALVAATKGDGASPAPSLSVEELEPDGGAAILVVPVLIVAACLVAALIEWEGWRGEQEPFPARGSIVDAQTGVASASWLVRPTPNSQGIPWQGVLRACNLSTEDCERWETPGGEVAVAARSGDTIDFRVRLHDLRSKPVSLLRLAAASVQSGGRAAVQLSIAWPVRDRRDPERLGRELHRDTVSLLLPPEAELVYSPETTVLYGSPGEESLIARLPEGIMDPGGIKLRNVGAPSGCWDCDLEYTRYVDFQARVE